MRINRSQAEQRVSEMVGRTISDCRLLSWELAGVLPAKGRGRNWPAIYNPRDVLTCATFARLRGLRVPFDQARRACVTLRRELGKSQLADPLEVTVSSDMITAKSDNGDVVLHRKPKPRARRFTMRTRVGCRRVRAS